MDETPTTSAMTKSGLLLSLLPDVSLSSFLGWTLLSETTISGTLKLLIWLAFLHSLYDPFLKLCLRRGGNGTTRAEDL